jgi:hypothetical protein
MRRPSASRRRERLRCLRSPLSRGASAGGCGCAPPLPPPRSLAQKPPRGASSEPPLARDQKDEPEAAELAGNGLRCAKATNARASSTSGGSGGCAAAGCGRRLRRDEAERLSEDGSADADASSDSDDPALRDDSVSLGVAADSVPPAGGAASGTIMPAGVGSGRVAGTAVVTTAVAVSATG